MQFSLKENKEHLISCVKNKPFGFLDRLFIYNYLKLWKASVKPADTLDTSWQAKKTNPNPEIENNLKSRVEEMTQQLRTLAAFSEGWSLVSSSQYQVAHNHFIYQLQEIQYSLLASGDILIHVHIHTYRHMHTQTHTHEQKISTKKRKEKKKYESYVSVLSSTVTMWFAYPPGLGLPHRFV